MTFRMARIKRMTKACHQLYKQRRIHAYAAYLPKQGGTKAEMDQVISALRLDLSSMRLRSEWITLLCVYYAFLIMAFYC